MEHDYNGKLRQNLEKHFNVDELRTLCFDMGIRHENLAGATLTSLARELVEYCDRHGQTSQLIDKCKQVRPHTNWPNISDNQPLSRIFEQERTRKISNGERPIKENDVSVSKRKQKAGLMANASRIFVGLVAIPLVLCCATFYIVPKALSGLLRSDMTPTSQVVEEQTRSEAIAVNAEPSPVGTLSLPSTSIPLPTAVPVASLEPAPIAILRSCQEILENGQSYGDDYYIVDADGSDGQLEPFEVYCDMTRQGGGWTLYAYHTDGIAVFEVANVTKTEPGVMLGEQWRAVRNNMIMGMMFVDELGRETTVSAVKLKRGNCQNVQNPETLIPPEIRSSHIWHNEDAGCNITGQDYSVITLQGPFYGNYRTAGASLTQWSAEKFDTWPYKADTSYGEQNELLYFIK